MRRNVVKPIVGKIVRAQIFISACSEQHRTVELMKLLIVEDNDRMRSLIRRTVADLAETIHECRDGAEALIAYNKNRPDCVLMDIKMGKMDGITATRNIRAAHPDARVIIVTDYDDDKLRLAAQRAGACRYLVKENLLAIREVLSELFPAG
jgi:CheY-like chemotaxis protein